MACASEPLGKVASLKLADSLHCPICLEVYTTPRALACLHTFCELCIHAHITKLEETDKLKDKIYCPVCREASSPPARGQLPCKWAKLLPMNYAILPVLEALQNKNECRVSDVTFCDSCSGGENRSRHAVKFCVDCQRNICENCVDCHKKYEMLQSHNLSELGNVSTKIKKQTQREYVDFCDEHPNKAIEYFCDDHQRLLCSGCVIVSHRLCGKVTSLVEMGRSLKKSDALATLQVELENIHPVFEEITKKLEDNVKQIENEANELPNQVKKLRENAMKVLDDLYEKVLMQSNSLKKTHILKISSEVFNYKMLVAAVEGSLVTLADMKENGSPTQIFITYKKLQYQMETYTDSMNRMETDVKCTALKLQLDTDLKHAIDKSTHTAEVMACYTPYMTSDMSTHCTAVTASQVNPYYQNRTGQDTATRTGHRNQDRTPQQGQDTATRTGHRNQDRTPQPGQDTATRTGHRNQDRTPQPGQDTATRTGHRNQDRTPQPGQDTATRTEHRNQDRTPQPGQDTATRTGHRNQDRTPQPGQDTATRTGRKYRW